MPTELFRDDHGVPHLRADDHLALAYAQGRVTARDRGWQIETDRLRTEGRLALLIGSAGVAWDVFARRARLADTARRAYQALGSEVRIWVDAYTAGVRHGLRETTPAEYGLLERHFGDRFEPDEWPDWAPLGILHTCHVLFGSMPALFWRTHVAATLGDAAVALFASDEPLSGSNAWALHGSRTAGGAPVLAGDPHRVIELPGVYQQLRLACPEFDVIGLAFPGVPGIAHFGHTGQAAWGITNATAHGADLFAERLRRTGSGYEALGPQGWQPTDLERSTVQVRGGEPMIIEAIETRRGPVVTELSQGSDAELTGFSLRSPARAEADLGFGALLPLLRARTAADVVAAFGRWVDPVNRLLAADTTGAVLSATVGRVPARASAERRLALDPTNTDLVAAAPMPAAIAVTDIAVDANERPARAEIDFGWDYPPPHRADRITALLAELRPTTIAELEPIWADVALGSAAPLLALLPAADRLGPAARAVRDELLGWEGRMTADDPAAARFVAWRAALAGRVAAEPVLAPLGRPHGLGAIFDPWFSVTARVAAALPRLLADETLGLPAESLIIAALEDAAATPAEPWGARHRLRPLHLLGEVDGLDPGAVPGADLTPELSGDNDTVRCTGTTPGVTDRCSRGSVARWAWDLGDRANSRWSVPFGASGDPASPHFADQLAGWVDVAPTKIETDWSRLRPDDLFDRSRS
ncbi:penicillin acylase family protein [Microlunatus speluncae]|uniref:penicillin acylase family protein n=1 Tax=Microlunatus speluncae TaxID=2594267 RepID=UPI001266684D|nr:penicillin acylase family protein [Microlunatus speluncae]